MSNGADSVFWSSSVGSHVRNEVLGGQIDPGSCALDNAAGVIPQIGEVDRQEPSPRKRWQRRIDFAATTGDQALVSVCNFSVAIIVGRILGPAGFGLFTLIWSVALLLNVAQQSFVIAPLFTFTAMFLPAERPRYFYRVLVVQILFACVACILGGLSFWICVAAGLLSPDLKILILPIAAACFAFQLQEFLRRLMQAARAPIVAFFCDLLTYGLQIGLLVRELFVHHSNLSAIFLILGGSWLIGCSFFLVVGRFLAVGKTQLIETARMHFSFGFSVALTNMSQWFASYGTLYLVGVVLSPAAVGNIRAAISVVAPLNVLAMGIQTYLSIEAAHVYQAVGMAGLVSLLRRATLRFLAACAPGVLICIWARPLMHFLLGPRFVVPTSWVVELFFCVVLGAVFGMTIVHFKTIARPILGAFAAALGLVITLGSTGLLVFKVGAAAAPAGLLIGQICTLGLAAYFWIRSAKDSKVV